MVLRTGSVTAWPANVCSTFFFTQPQVWTQSNYNIISMTALATLWVVRIEMICSQLWTPKRFKLPKSRFVPFHRSSSSSRLEQNRFPEPAVIRQQLLFFALSLCARDIVLLCEENHMVSRPPSAGCFCSVGRLKYFPRPFLFFEGSKR